MRLVDADALLKCIPYEDVNSRFAVQNAPTIEERKKGKWICKHLPASIGSKVFVEVNICSNCGHVVDSNELSNFCSVCGYDMRGENNG